MTSNLFLEILIHRLLVLQLCVTTENGAGEHTIVLLSNNTSIVTVCTKKN
jgi:hypothetical protein